MKFSYIFITIILFLFSIDAHSQRKKTKEEDKAKNENIYGGLKFRSIGPAFMSGRISDIVIHPENENMWYVTVGSGGVWKTDNAGTTWSSIFDGQNSYSIGCISLDPQDANTVWVGTGENVGGRHVAYGDGIYRSRDGGKSWENMGLKKSEHISKIIIHPENSSILWVASQGPLWSKGGERGLYKSTDGGETWERKLGDDEWVGATDVLIDPRNPNVLYAATWQRHRTVAGYMGGGPGTAIYKSEDGGENWRELKSGLPTSKNMGKIGLAISPQQPDVVYAAIELDRRTGGVYRSEDRGESWKKMSDAVAGGTGPHYYQELYASPHEFDKIFLVNNVTLISEDGGKNFNRLNVKTKHVDDHAIAFKKSDPNYILFGCDGGLYETFDNTKTWKFIDNLPVTQFYKIAVDDAEPYYYVYGGTQDNNTQGGPSRTDNVHGIRNSDWFVVLFGDGHQPATEPGNPNIVYAQWQQGNLVRHDRKTGEIVYVQPQARYGEKTERFNWDAPILVSPHKPSRIYHASQRVWKSDDRGDSWQPISGDLTNNIERVSTLFFDEEQKWDNPWDIYAMSNFSTITSLTESPVKEGLIYAGTDDGLIQVTENGGESWRKIELSTLPGLPKTAFVNDIKADLFDENIVYAVFDNHKEGDYAPYLYKSNNKGKTWERINEGIPERHLLWRIVQDHEDKNLLFLGTEYGVYFSNDQGRNWKKLKSGMPTIAVRDLAIQKRENDLVIGTFGRGIFILDDYSALRNFDASKVDTDGHVFQPRAGDWFIPQRPLGGGKKASQGDNYFVADNPPFGVEITYYLKERYKNIEATRLEKEKELEKAGESIGFPDWSDLEEEKRAINPVVWMFIYDEQGEIIKKIAAKNNKGMNRVVWDMTKESVYPVTKKDLEKNPSGAKVAPGKFTAQLFKQENGNFKSISNKVDIKIEKRREGSLKGASNEEVAAFWQDVQKTYASVRGLNNEIEKAKKKADLMLTAYNRASKIDDKLASDLIELRDDILRLDQKMNGSKARSEVGEKNEYPTVWNYLSYVSLGTSYSTYGPTASHKENLAIAVKMKSELETELKDLTNALSNIDARLKALGAPEWKD